MKQGWQKSPAGTRQTDGKNHGLVWRNRKGLSSVEMVYGESLTLPGEFLSTEQPSASFLQQLRQQMRSFQPPAIQDPSLSRSHRHLSPLFYKHSLCTLRGGLGILETNKKLGSNRNKPKQDLFWLCFSLFHETKIKKFRFVFGLLVFRTYIQTIKTNRTVSKQTEINQKNPKFSEKYQNLLSIKLFRLVSVCFSSIETSKLSVLV